MSLFFAVPKDCTVRAHIFSCREENGEEGSAGAQEGMGGLYVLSVLLNLGLWRNGQEKIKKV